MARSAERLRPTCPVRNVRARAFIARCSHRSPVVQSAFADVVIMNFPMNHLSDSEALLAVKEVASLPSLLCPRASLLTRGLRSRCGVCSRAAALPSSENRTGDTQPWLTQPLRQPPSTCPILTRFAWWPRDGNGDGSPNGGSRYAVVLNLCRFHIQVSHVFFAGCGSRVANQC